ncbi:MAG TPA: response regulator transcription factor [Candidatus Dojkabacteria bacterium]|nr:response regulator transcription factor [Candidatus Dojkabacteria bacterium]
MYKKEILIVEDSPGLIFVLEKYLKKQGYKVVCTCNGSDGIRLGIENDICLAIIDIGLPDICGLKVVEKIKEVKKNLSIIAISQPKDIEKEINIYKKGVNIFHKKPICFELLGIQIENLVPDCKNNIFKTKNVLIDITKGVVRRKNKEISLTKMEKICLEYLLESDGHVCTRENILKRLNINYEERSLHCIDTLICRLRKKLGHCEEEIIETVSGIGYRILIPRDY